ncbi:hypothetical protein BJ508DRAFT_336882 [Ascobolus immersus RN42]|uniref:Uncharacterized protein n=1 Tax=Ascobolus immersus RN42 TaxID=1160509 RepID=A0A3N4H755_ASCIM|nr:hypothetical protein BJ508DRAFT_336882 [Ascobolus immersus RN42]
MPKGPGKPRKAGPAGVRSDTRSRLASIFIHIASLPDLCTYVSEAFHPDHIEHTCNTFQITEKEFYNLRGMFDTNGNPPDPKHLLKAGVTKEQYCIVQNCFFAINTAKTEHKNRAAILLKELLHSNQATPEVSAFLETICESEAVSERWAAWVITAPLPDEREKVGWCQYFPHCVIDESKLQLDVGLGENLVMRDRASGELIGFVYSDLVKNPQVLEWMDNVIAAGCETLKSVRKEDPGKLGMVGYAAGARNARCLNWKKSWDSGDIAGPYRCNKKGIWDHFDRNISSVFALGSNLLVRTGPKEVVRDYKKAINKYSLPRMDGQRSLIFIEYRDPLTALPHRFDLMDKAAPLGAYTVSFTTGSKGGKEKGGHFYISDYGIRIQGGSNRMVGWQQGELHGTSIPDIDDFGNPNPGDFFQRGYCQVESKQLPKAIQNHVERYGRA